MSHPSSKTWCRGLLLVVVLITLWAGLDPKDYRFRNEVEWLADRPGLRFGKYGRVQTEPFLIRAQAAELNRGGFTLELAKLNRSSARHARARSRIFENGRDAERSPC